METIGNFFTNIIKDYSVKFPEKYKEELIIEQLTTNLSRERIYSTVLVIWNILMSIYLWMNRIEGGWIKTPSYKYLFILHFLGTIVFITILLSINQCFKNMDKNVLNYKILNFVFIEFFLMWTSISTIISNSVNQQMFLYVGSLFLVSITLRLNSIESLICYAIPLFTLVILVFFNNHSTFITKEGLILDGFILNIFNLIFANIVYSSFIKDFINRKTIYEKSIELEAAKDELTEAVNRRTEELLQTNEQLIQEINKMHTMEIQMFKTKLENQEKERLLDEAKEYERIRGEFFANISHEFRTPLNIIFCTIQMIALYTSKTPDDVNKVKIEKHIKSMKQNCYRLVRLVNNLIDITKIDAGYFELNLSNNNIVKIIENITLSLREYVESFGITLSFESELNEKKIACDPDIIERVILNLLSNAVKFTEPGGLITVGLYQKRDKIIIKVKDTGIGIPIQKQKIIFERFAQVDKSLTRQKEGSGIGLSLVKSLVEMHNGQISVESRKNKGSEFLVQLPDELINDQDKVDDVNYAANSKTEIISIEFSDIYKDIS